MQQLTHEQFNTLAHECHELSKAKGWWDSPVTEYTKESKLALIVSELAEALECVRNGDNTLHVVDTEGCKWPYNPRAHAKCKPEGLPSECADVVIRIFDFSVKFGVDCEPRKADHWDLPPSPTDPEFTSAFLFCTMGHVFKQELGIVIERLEDLARAYGFDLYEAVRIKHAYNATRPHRHGGKAI